MTQPAFSNKVARYLAEEVARQGHLVSAERLQEIASGDTATDDESDAIHSVAMTVVVDFINHGPANYDLINRYLSTVLTPAVSTTAKTAIEMLQVCTTLISETVPATRCKRAASHHRYN
ncbi:hypothetical protein ABIA30_004060 [Mycobacterium sp. MAA66]|uniref:hypothetical protein n=1 Tax=Mycobacterium sp. MAA66 TaxID=3156297 RepID=UPI003513DE59